MSEVEPSVQYHSEQPPTPATARLTRLRLWGRPKASAKDLSDRRIRQRAGPIGDWYTVSTVILAGSLVLASTANRFEWVELRAVVVGAAPLVLLCSVMNILRLPVA
jgi:hypothetical protein